MPGFDDRLRQHLERLAPPADPSGAFDRVLEKRIKRRLMRRFQAAGLAVAVVAATVGGTFALVRAFESRDDDDRLGRVSPTPVLVSNGLIAFSRNESVQYDIWTVNSDGTGAVNITVESADSEYVPAWSPDGTKIAFVREMTRTNDRAIYVMNADGTNPIRLKDIGASNHALAWSPDGNRIAYISSGDLFVMNADGSEARRLTSGSKRLDFRPTWSPDGSWIAFARYTFAEPLSTDPFIGQEPSGSGIWLVRPDGSGSRRLTEGSDSEFGTEVDDAPDWSPDGRRIVFQRANDIYVVNTDGSGMKMLTQGGISEVPSWSPDGARIVFQRQADRYGEIYGLYVMNSDGSRETQLRVGAVEQSIAPDWQPIPASAPPTSPTAEPSPTTSPFPAECDASQVTGNFDGDEQPDTATVARTQCLMNPDELGSRATDFALRVQWPPSEGIAPLPDCRKACQAVAAADLNGDSIDEFILMVDKGASTDNFQVYELPASEAFGRAVAVAPPGGRDFPRGETAEFSLFGSVTHFTAIGCDLINHQVIVQSAVQKSDPSQYTVHETLLRFETTDSPPFGEFHVVAERDFTERLDEGVSPGDQFEPGDPCWIYGG